MKVGLFFGSFNPIHVGHLILANYFAQNTELDEVWLVVSPANPLKSKSSLLADHHRLAMVRIAIEDNQKLKASNVEFDLERPSYTIHTLVHLQEKYPKHSFSLIIGEDNLRSFHKWKNHEQIIENHKLYVYPRLKTDLEQTNHIANKRIKEWLKNDNVELLDAPIIQISSSEIRRQIGDGKDVQYLLTEAVLKYCREMHFYEK